MSQPFCGSRAWLSEASLLADIGIKVIDDSHENGKSSGCEPPRYCCHLGCILLKTPAISLLTGDGDSVQIAFTNAQRDEITCDAQTF